MAMIPADPWLYSLLDTEVCFVYGVLGSSDYSLVPLFTMRALMEQMTTSDYANLPWADVIGSHQDGYSLVYVMMENLVSNGVPALGHEVEASRVLISVGLEIADSLRGGWREIYNPDATRFWFEETKGTVTLRISLEAALTAFESTLLQFNHRDAIPYVAEIKTKRVERSPESLIARIWNECLGPRAIPFDLKAREALIADGCKHPELKRHIEAWQEMKRTGSKWVNHRSLV
jgi:hypothetical protein